MPGPAMHGTCRYTLANLLVQSQKKNQGMRVVLDITEGLRGKTITCDNFFISYALGLQLLKKKLYMLGTVRRNKPELPPALVSKTGRARFSSKFAFTETHALVSYHAKNKKNVLLMSTLHRDAAVSNRDDKRPKIIEDYNHNKGGVDNLDKVIHIYLFIIRYESEFMVFHMEMH